MTSRSRDFESRASTNSAIPAQPAGGIITENPNRGNSHKRCRVYRYNTRDENSGF
jgi:hypothetical protein